MLARACSAAVNDIEAHAVEVEVNSGWGETIIVMVVSINRKTGNPFTFGFSLVFMESGEHTRTKL
jgi:hypothetical protein